MALSITPINEAIDTFQIWVDRTNEIIDVISNNAITANSNANGSLTTGNAYVNGIFAAVTLTVVTELRGGNVQSSNTLNVSSNVSFTNTAYFSANVRADAILHGNTIVANSGIRGGNTSVSGPLFVSSNIYLTNTSTIATLAITTTGTSAQLIDTLLLLAHRSAEYVVCIKDNAANGYHTQKLMLLQNGTDVDFTEYGIVFSNVSLGAFSANANATHARLYFTPTSANTTIKGNRIAIDI